MAHDITARADLPSGTQAPRSWPPGVAAVLSRVEELLESTGPRKALDYLAQAGPGDPWVANARGGCLLRMGETGAALELFRALVLGAGSGLRHEAPTVFKTNYATA